MKCKKCGKRLRNSEKFCTYCGYFNDAQNEENWNNEEINDNLLEENWYEYDIDVKDEEEIVIPSNKKKTTKKEQSTKKETKSKKEKPKKEKEVKI